MPWPFEKKPGEPDKPEEKPVEKTESEKQAELIAQSIKDSFAPINERFAALEQKLEGMRQPERPAPNPEKISVLDDEDGAFAQRQGPIIEATLETRADFVKREIKDQNKEAFQQFGKEIEDELSKSPVQARCIAKYVQNVVDMVLGRKLKELGYRLDTTSGRFFAEDSGGSGLDTPVEQDGLNADQRAFLTKQGIPLDRGKEMLKHLRIVH